MKAKKSLEQQYPSVPLAYDLAIKSYDWVYRRSEIIDNKIEKLIAWATGLNLALVAFIGNLIRSNTVINYYSIWLYAAIALFIVGTTSGMIAKLKGSMKTVTPSMLINGWLHQSEWEFKKNALYRASEDHDFNKKYVNKKGLIATIAAFSFFAEAIVLAIWLIRQ